SWTRAPRRRRRKASRAGVGRPRRRAGMAIAAHASRTPWSTPMKALCWHGKEDIRYETVPDPEIEHPRDAIIKMSCCAICGSDLHFFDGFMPGMKSGDVVGHAFMGEVVEVGAENRKLKVGDRVVVPFTICCGDCEQCRR